MAFVRSEPRGKDFHITVDSPIGPDAECRQHGNRVLVDYSGVADSRNDIYSKPNVLTLANTNFRW